jgi:acyl-coenzyme A thioesterase PaaI-like protein
VGVSEGGLGRRVGSVLDEATAVRRVGEGRYQVLPDARFAIVAPGGAVPSAMNGGVMVATALRAVLDSSPHPYPVATSAHFLRVPRLEPAEVEVTWLKQGRTAATARATVVQDALAVLEVTVTTGSLPADPAANGELSWTGEPPRLPPIEECVNLGHWAGTIGPDGTAGYAAQVDLRLDPATIGWRRGQPAGIPEMRGYFRLREDRDPDAYMLALAVDGLPPVVFGLGAAGWAPTVELTWHMRAVPAPGPLRVATRCRHVSGGWFDEEAEVWDAAGRLVAQSRQIARVGRGASSAKI